MFSKVRLIHGHTGASVFMNGLGYDQLYHFKAKSDHAVNMMQLIHDVGVPASIVSDGEKTLVCGKTWEVYREYRIDAKKTVPYSPWQNLAEASIRDIKIGCRHKLRQTAAPLQTWSYCAIWVTGIRHLMASDNPMLNGVTGMEHVTGSTPDISPLALFDFWQPVYFLMPVEAYPHEKKVIGRWLRVAKDCTDEMAFVVLPISGVPITRKSVWAIPDDDLKNPVIAARLADYDTAINEWLKPMEGRKPSDESFPDPPKFLFEGDEEEPLEGDPEEDPEYTPEELDEYLSAEVMLPCGGETVRATIKKRARDDMGRPVGLRNDNPILDTRLYEVEFPDGSRETYNTNLIAENLYAMLDDEGNAYNIIK